MIHCETNLSQVFNLVIEEPGIWFQQKYGPLNLSILTTALGSDVQEGGWLRDMAWNLAPRTLKERKYDESHKHSQLRSGGNNGKGYSVANGV